MAKVRQGQNILDVALQHCGAFEAAFDVAEKNGVSMTDDLTAGEDLETPAAVNVGVATRYVVNNTVPATGITADDISEILGAGEGVDFWALENEFTVS